MQTYSLNAIFWLILGRFQTPSVICSLCDLTGSEDPNIRAVAAIGLGRAGNENQEPFTSSVFFLLVEEFSSSNWIFGQIFDAILQQGGAHMHLGVMPWGANLC